MAEKKKIGIGMVFTLIWIAVAIYSIYGGFTFQPNTPFLFKFIYFLAVAIVLPVLYLSLEFVNEKFSEKEERKNNGITNDH